MNRRSVVAAMVIAASMLASEAMYATPLAMHAPVYAMFGRVKLVSFSVLNSTNVPIKVKAGDAVMTLEPGKVVPMKLAAGTKIVAVEAVAHYKAGSVLVSVVPELSDDTVTLQ